MAAKFPAINLVLVSALTIFCLSEQKAGAQSRPPLFNLVVPTSPLASNSSSSSLERRFGDTAGNTLYVLAFSTNQTTPGIGGLPGNTFSSPVGKQVVLVKSTGKVVASASFTSFALDVFSVSASKILMSTNGTNISLFVPVNGQLVANGVVLNHSGRTLERAEVPKPDSKFIDAVTKSNGFVTRIERFNTSTLRP